MNIPADIALRGGIFLGVLLALVFLEAVIGGPNPPAMRGRRWPANVGLILVGTLLARLALPVGVVGVAAWSQARGVGLLNQFDLPASLGFALALVLLDLAIYWQHRLLHAWPLLWRLHRAHHLDVTLDATSALRFHPLEILLSLAFKVALVVALGVTPLAAMVFEVLLSSFALVTHANNRHVSIHLRDRFPFPYEVDHGRKFLDWIVQQASPTVWAIEVNGETAGGIGVELHQDVERVSAEIGYWLGEAAWGRGIVTEALQAVTAEVFRRFDLTRIYALPFADHRASVRVLEKAGYTLEGHLRQSAIKDGVIRDQLLYAAYK